MLFYRLWALIFSLLLFSGCNAEDQNSRTKNEELISGSIELSNGWVRPGARGMMSAAYLTISNGTASADTLVGVSSGAARKAEIHQSYKGENGMSAMRPAPNSVIAPGENLYLQPGGLHIMLIKLTDDLAPGDSVNLRIEFEKAGTRTIQLPVKAQN